MKRFRFSLDTLLSLRREKEQEREIALAVAAGGLADIDRRIDEARSKGERVFLSGAASLEALQARDRVWQKSMADIRSLQAPRDEAVAAVDRARAAYAEAHAQRAALDRLREKRRDHWKAEARREEIKRLDETAKGAAVRRRLTGGDE